MRFSTTTVVLSLSVFLLGLSACDEKSETDKAASKSEGTDKPTDGKSAGGQAEKPAEAKDEAPKIDSDYQALLDAIAANCEIKVSGCTVRKCANKEYDQFRTLWNEKKKKKTEALDTLAVMLADADENKRTVASNVMSQRFGSTLNPEPGPVSKSTSGRLIDAVSKIEGCQASQSVKTTVHAAMLAEDDDRLFAMIAAHKSEYVAKLGYRNLMHHGRIRPLDKMKELAKTAEPRELAALVRAPRKMHKASDQEKEAVCPWAQSFLSHEDGNVAYEAGFTMAYCGGKYVEALLAEGEKRLTSGTFDKPFASVFREPCAAFIKTKRTDQENATCEKVYTFLEKVGTDGRASSEVRGRALWNIYYQERTQATYDRLKKYAHDKDPEVKKQVEDAMKSLEKNYGAK